MTKSYTWMDTKNGFDVWNEKQMIQLASIAIDGSCSVSTLLLPHEARNLANALLIAVEAAEEEKET